MRKNQNQEGTVWASRLESPLVPLLFVLKAPDFESYHMTWALYFLHLLFCRFFNNKSNKALGADAP